MEKSTSKFFNAIFLKERQIERRNQITQTCNYNGNRNVCQNIEKIEINKQRQQLENGSKILSATQLIVSIGCVRMYFDRQILFLIDDF